LTRPECKQERDREKKLQFKIDFHFLHFASNSYVQQQQQQ